MTETGLERTQWVSERLIDSAINLGGSFSLAYHRWARKEHLLKCYPELPGFFELKRKYDPHDTFQSSWYRHVKYLLLEGP